MSGNTIGVNLSHVQFKLLSFEVVGIYIALDDLMVHQGYSIHAPEIKFCNEPTLICLRYQGPFWLLCGS